MDACFLRLFIFWVLLRPLLREASARRESMKLYNWAVECLIHESGKEPRRETVEVQAINDERVARSAAVLKREAWPFQGQVIARKAYRREFVKEFV